MWIAILLGVVPFWLWGQPTDCSQGRYFSPIFGQVNVDSDIQFGANLQPTLFNPLNVQDLFLDVYQPGGDNLSQRPLIVWAFGGAFVFGNRTSDDIVELATRFSKMGYVNAAIDYRLTGALAFNGNDSLANVAVIKAMHDMRAAIRFFYKSAQQGNPYGIDTNHIYIGGVSAGAITAVHTGYLNDLSEWPPQVDTTGFGGIAGNSGNPGYSDAIAGIINLAGGIGDTQWIQAGEPPILSMHGDKDDVVPYGTDTVDLFNLGLLLHGSASVHEHAVRLGMRSELYTYAGAGHVPFTQNNAQGPYMDTTINEIKTFLYPLVCGSAPPLAIDPTLPEALSVYPNPARQYLRIEAPDRPGHAQLIDGLGRVVWQEALQGPTTLQRGPWPNGWYILRWQTERESRQQSILWQ